MVLLGRLMPIRLAMEKPAPPHHEEVGFESDSGGLIRKRPHAVRQANAQENGRS